MNPYDILRAQAAAVIEQAELRVTNAEVRATAAAALPSGPQKDKAAQEAAADVATAALDRVAACRAAAALLRDAVDLETGKAFL